MMIEAYVGMGSNLGEAEAQLCTAARLLSEAQGLDILKLSPLYWTEPQGMQDQPWFANRVARLACDAPWTAQSLLEFLLQVEKDLGRQRSPDPALRFGPRALDLDLLLFGQEKCVHPQCMVPHPRMLLRAFVLVPLQDVMAQDMLPGGTCLSHALDRLCYRVEGQKIYQSS